MKINTPCYYVTKVELFKFKKIEFRMMTHHQTWSHGANEIGAFFESKEGATFKKEKRIQIHKTLNSFKILFIEKEFKK